MVEQLISTHQPSFKSPLGYFENLKTQYNRVTIVANDCNPSNWWYCCTSWIESLRHVLSLPTWWHHGLKTEETIWKLKFLQLCCYVHYLDIMEICEWKTINLRIIPKDKNITKQIGLTFKKWKEKDEIRILYMRMQSSKAPLKLYSV